MTAKTSFRGSFTALVTPFKNGAVDEQTFRKIVDWQIAEGTNGLVPVGTTGESPTLSHDEHKQVVEWYCTVFQSYEWVSAWQRNIGTRSGTIPAVVVGYDNAGALLFIAPLAVEARGFVRELTWLGSDLCDYNAPLLAPDFSRKIDAARFVSMWREIAARLQKDPRTTYDVVRFSKMPEKLGGQANPFLALGVGTHPSGAYLTHLPTTGRNSTPRSARHRRGAATATTSMAAAHRLPGGSDA